MLVSSSAIDFLEFAREAPRSFGLFGSCFVRSFDRSPDRSQIVFVGRSTEVRDPSCEIEVNCNRRMRPMHAVMSLTQLTQSQFALPTVGPCQCVCVTQ